MNDMLPIIDATVKYLIVPAVLWMWLLHKTQGLQATELAVLRAEAAAREQARVEQAAATVAQLEQIIAMLQTINGRIDAVMVQRSVK